MPMASDGRTGGALGTQVQFFGVICTVLCLKFSLSKKYFLPLCR